MALETVISELNRLRSAGIIGDYAFGGAVGAQLYIEPGTTHDVDVFVIVTEPDASSLAPLQSIYSDLILHGAKQDHEYLVIGGEPLQVLTDANPLYTDAIKNARSDAIGNEIGRFMTPEHLAAIALETGRNKDKLRLLQFIENGVLNMPAFEDLVNRFGLGDKWNSFQSAFLTTK